MVLTAYIRETCHAVFEETVEGQLVDDKRTAAVLHLLDTLVDTFLHHFVGVGGLTLYGCLDEQSFVNGSPFRRTVAVEAVEVSFIVFLDQLLDKQLLYLARSTFVVFP